MKRLLPILMVFGVFLGSAGESFALPPRDEGFESLFACSLEIIEETRVDLSGSTLLKPHQRKFRNLLRLRIRNVPQPTAPSTSVKPPFYLPV